MNQAADELESIRQLKARYCRFLDTKDVESWRSVFTPTRSGSSTAPRWWLRWVWGTRRAIPGTTVATCLVKKRMYMGCTGGIPESRRRCDEITAGGYTGFELT